MRTMPSVMCKFKQEATKSTPKRVLRFVSGSAGGILEATSAGALPRGRQQIKDAKRKSTSKQDFDLLYSIMHQGRRHRDGGYGHGRTVFWTLKLTSSLLPKVESLLVYIR